MDKVTVIFSEICGKIKPMNAVNNGPKIPLLNGDQTVENHLDYKAARIPYARTHDSALCGNYGGEHVVDIHCVFPDFDADADLPESYDFTLTDRYLKSIEEAGTKVFYRLGESIEYRKKKYAILVPRDFSKWARICEHIIRHYTEGWADGFFMDIEYWEIWNEADGDAKDPIEAKRTWMGTPEEYYELYCVAAAHLKKCFPKLKIGGPAVSTLFNSDWVENFFKYITAKPERVPLDFFSWHLYTYDPKLFAEHSQLVRGLLEKYGYGDAESILNEWNYNIDWQERFIESVETINSMKGAAFTAASILVAQDSPVDMLMYYDARPNTTFNGMFDYISLEKQKTYYVISGFSDLAECENQVKAEISGDDLYCVAAANGEGYEIMLCYYSNELGMPKKTIELDLQDVLPGDAEFYLLDERSDNRLVKRESIQKDHALLHIEIEPQSVLFIKGGALK